MLECPPTLPLAQLYRAHDVQFQVQFALVHPLHHATLPPCFESPKMQVTDRATVTIGRGNSMEDDSTTNRTTKSNRHRTHQLLPHRTHSLISIVTSQAIFTTIARNVVVEDSDHKEKTRRMRRNKAFQACTY